MKPLFNPNKRYNAAVKDIGMLRRLLVYAGFGAAALAAMGVLAGIFYLYTVTRDLPSVQALQNYSPAVTTRVYAGNGAVLGEYARESRIFVPTAFIPKLVAMGLALLVFLPWMLQLFKGFFTELLEMIPSMLR